MKRLFVFLICLICAFGAHADNNNTVTSKDYVDAQIQTLQDEIPAISSNAVLTHTGTSGQIGSKKIYDETADYMSQTDALMTADTFNTAVQNAIDTEFVCIDWLGEHVPGNCLLWQINTPQTRPQLPTGYTQLEYLESNNNQYINTGILASTENISIEIQYMPERNHEDDHHRQGVLGAQTSNYSNGIMVNVYNKVVVLGISRLSIETALNTKHTLKLSTYNSTATIDFDNNRIYNSIYNGSIISNAPIYLFGYGYGEQISSASGYFGRIYYCKLSQNTETVLDLVPARRDIDGKLGMYDIVSNRFLTNSGTGEFIAGPEINLYLPSNN